MPDGNGLNRVLVKVGEDNVGGVTVERYEWVDVTPEQAMAYANADPTWRSAGESWISRLWHRVK